jgi:hypothetical protein
MGKSTPATQNQSASSTTAPLLGQDQLKGILGAAPSASSLATTPYEQMALQQLQQNGTNANQFTQGLTNAATNAVNGGGFGAGDAALTAANANATSNLTPYANGSNLDPSTNSAYEALLNSLKTGVNNSVMDQFNAAGRSFSPAEAGALGTAYTNAIAPYAFGQYNQNVGNQFTANQILSGNALQGAQQQNASAGGILGAQAQAPTAISNINTPAGMQLAAGQTAQQFPIQNLQGLSSLVLPIAQGGGSTQSGNSTTTQTPAQGSLLQQLAGDVLGVGGILGQGGAFGKGGLFTNWLT